MALRWFDGFDYYATADLPLLYTVGTSPTVQSTVTRFSTGGALNGTGNGRTLDRVLDAQATWIVGIGFRLSGTVTGSGSGLIKLMDGATFQLTLVINTSMQLEVRRGDTGGTLLATSTNVISADTWYWLELKATIHNTTGAYEVRVNGTATGWIPAATGQNTRNGANNQATIVRFGRCDTSSNPTNWYFDDLYICDGTGSAPGNTFLGEVRSRLLTPDGAGNYQQWTINGGASRQADVDKTTPNDTTYNSSATVSDRDSFTFDDLAGVTTIFGVKETVRALKDDAGTRTIAAFARISSTDYDGASQNISLSAGYYSQLWEVSPATSAAWTVSEFNGAEFGYKEVA